MNWFGILLRVVCYLPQLAWGLLRVPYALASLREKQQKLESAVRGCQSKLDRHDGRLLQIRKLGEQQQQLLDWSHALHEWLDRKYGEYKKHVHLPGRIADVPGSDADGGGAGSRATTGDGQK